MHWPKTTNTMLVFPQVSIAPTSIENSSGVIRNRGDRGSTFFGRIGVPRCRVPHLGASTFLSRLTASGLSISAFYLRLRFLHNVATATTAPVASARSATVLVLTPLWVPWTRVQAATARRPPR